MNDALSNQMEIPDQAWKAFPSGDFKRTVVIVNVPQDVVETGLSVDHTKRDSN